MKQVLAAIALVLGAALSSSVLAKDSLHTGLYLVDFSDLPV